MEKEVWNIGVSDQEHDQHSVSLLFMCSLHAFQGLYDLLSIHPPEVYWGLFPINYHITFFSEDQMTVLVLYWKYIPIT